MAQKKTQKQNSISRKNEREQKLLYEQQREAKRIEDILDEFKNYDESAMPQISSEDLKTVDPEYGFDVSEYVKAIFSGKENELQEEPVPTIDDFKLDPKIFEPEEEDIQIDEADLFADIELNPISEEMNFFSDLFASNPSEMDSNNSTMDDISTIEIDDLEKTKIMSPVIKETSGIEINIDNYSENSEYSFDENDYSEGINKYSFDDDDSDYMNTDSVDDDFYSTRTLRKELFTTEFDEKFREMFSGSLDNEDKKMGNRKTRNVMMETNNVQQTGVSAGKTKKRRKIWVWLFLIFFVIFALSAYKFISTYLSQLNESNRLEELATIVAEAEKNSNNINNVDSEQSASDEDNHEILPQYKELAELNPDMIGWISIPNTVINYPVMYTPGDPEYYLHRDFDGNNSSSGMIFVDSFCDIENGDNQIIYGHNMRNDSMFGSLDKYASKDFWKKNQYIKYNTLYEEHEYQVVCVFQARVLNKDEDGFRYYRFYGSENEEEFNEYVENIKNLELYDTGVDISYGDKLITLSTCAYFTDEGRFVVVAKQVS